METQQEQPHHVEDNESVLTMTESVSGFPNVVAQISVDDDDEPFIIQHEAVDVLAMNDDESDDSDNTDLFVEETNADDGVLAHASDNAHPAGEPAVLVIPDDDMPETGEPMEHPAEEQEEQLEELQEDKEPQKPEEELLQHPQEDEFEALQHEEPQELNHDEPRHEFEEEEQLQEEEPQEYGEEQQQEVEQNPQHYEEEQLQQDRQYLEEQDQQEFLEEHQQDEQQEYPAEYQQQDEQQEYTEEQQQEYLVEQHQEYLEEQSQEYVEEQHQDPPEERQDPPEEFLAEQEEQLDYSEDLHEDPQSEGSGEFAAAIPHHVVSQDSGDDDDDDSEAFRRDMEQPKVLHDFGVVHASHENESNVENSSIFANSYNGIVEQLDTSLLTEAKSITPENYDNVNGSQTDDFDEYLEGDAPNIEATSAKPDNFFPYPDNILIPIVTTSSHAPTKDSTSSPPPPEPFLTPRRINILVATLCFVLVASVGVAVGSFLAQQAGKSTPQSSAVNSNENGTTAAPSSSPSISPTGAFNWSEGDCEDHPFQKFNVNERFGDQDCIFLQSHPAQRERLCLPDNEGYRWCPVTCSVCNGEGPNIPPIAPVPAPPVATPTQEIPPTSRPIVAGNVEPTIISSTVEPSAPLVDTLAPTRAIVVPTASPTITTATPAPTAAADDARSVITAALKDSFSVDLDDMNTAQGNAFDWVSRNSADLPSWRIPQQFALAGLAYSAGVGAWLGNGDECSWSGITCDSNGLVTGIELREAGLQGSLFPELYMLSNSLMTLNTGQNSMGGAIPSELGLLQNLQLLQLDRNKLSGPIPGSLGRLRNLKVLNLEENSLTGSLPAQMEDMPLLHFRFYSNGLTGSIFESWCARGNMKLEADCNEIDCPCCSTCY